MADGTDQLPPRPLFSTWTEADAWASHFCFHNPHWTAFAADAGARRGYKVIAYHRTEKKPSRAYYLDGSYRVIR